ncbi:MAG: nucleotidyltransferase family protein, partial [Verrucomicrobia bacterium]|nr:nucleotidyltransferase family protein [Verrucomicrobiota bacterium]
MKAVILAAGKGTRMKELTNELPKPMLRVQGKPILEHIIEGLITAGIREICIITGWRAEVIEDYFGSGKKWNIVISYARQVVQDGTGKAPELAKAFVGQENFLLTYGDILVKPETYQRMVQRFGEGNFSGLLTVTHGEDVTKGGLNFFDDQFCLRRLIEKPSAAQVEQL